MSDQEISQQGQQQQQQQQQQTFSDNDIDNNRNNNNNETKPYLIQVSTTLPSLQTINTFLTTPNCGAISLFMGTTRDNFQNKPVLRLSYEGYAPMAVKELRKLADEARERYPSVEKVVAVHLLGDCPVGETSVIVGCASHHRRDGIRCTEFLIDELKARVPIWKKEVYGGEGEEGAVWKENVEWKEGRRRRVMIKEDIEK